MYYLKFQKLKYSRFRGNSPRSAKLQSGENRISYYPQKLIPVKISCQLMMWEYFNLEFGNETFYLKYSEHNIKKNQAIVNFDQKCKKCVSEFMHSKYIHCDSLNF